MILRLRLPKDHNSRNRRLRDYNPAPGGAPSCPPENGCAPLPRSRKHDLGTRYDPLTQRVDKSFHVSASLAFNRVLRQSSELSGSAIADDLVQIRLSDESMLTAVKKHLRPGRVYRREDFTPWSASVDRHLKALVDAGNLKKLGYGLYYYPKRFAFGEAPASEHELLQAFSRPIVFS